MWPYPLLVATSQAESTQPFAILGMAEDSGVLSTKAQLNKPNPSLTFFRLVVYSTERENIMNVMKELAEWKEKLQARENELLTEIDTQKQQLDKLRSELNQVKKALGRQVRSHAYVSIGSRGLTAWILNALAYEPMTATEIRDGFFGDRVITANSRRAGLNNVNARLHMMVGDGRLIACHKPGNRRGRIFSTPKTKTPIPTTWKPTANTTTRSNKQSQT